MRAGASRGLTLLHGPRSFFLTNGRILVGIVLTAAFETEAERDCDAEAGCPRFAPWVWALTWDHRQRRLADVGSRHAGRAQTLPADATLPFRDFSCYRRAAELPLS